MKSLITILTLFAVIVCSTSSTTERTPTYAASVTPSNRPMSPADQPTLIQTVYQQKPIAVQRPGEGFARSVNLDNPTPLRQGVFEQPIIRKPTAAGPRAENPAIHPGPVGPVGPRPGPTPYGPYPGSMNPNRFEDPVIKRAAVPQPDGPTASNIPGMPDRPWSSMEQEVKANMAAMTKEMVEKPKEKARIMFEGRNRLGDEARKLGGEVRFAVGNLLKARQLALRLNQLLVRYQTKLDKDTAILPIPDQVAVKNQLIAKLTNELEGIRTPSDKFPALTLVNPTQIDALIGQIKAKLNI